ncbi:MAG: alpha/beta fold hydrolase [Bdellovibrionota bacterium]
MLRRRFWILGSVGLWSTQILAQASPCVNAIENGVLKETRRLETQYRRMTKGRDGIKHDNAGRFKRGTRPHQAILLLHGFISSPFEVDPLARQFQQNGFTTYEPLLPGFGSSSEVANHSSLVEWQESVRSNLRLLTECYDEVTLVGFSLGGALAMDFALSNDPDDLNLQKDVARLALISPLVKPTVKLGATLNNFLRVFTRLVSLKDLYNLSHNPDLQVPMSFPKFYNDRIPLNAVAQTLKLSRRLQGLPRHETRAIETYLSVSEMDETVDWKKSVSFVQTHFPAMHLRHFDADENIPHQLPLSPAARTLGKDLRNFVQSL